MYPWFFVIRFPVFSRIFQVSVSKLEPLLIDVLKFISTILVECVWGDNFKQAPRPKRIDLKGRWCVFWTFTCCCCINQYYPKCEDYIWFFSPQDILNFTHSYDQVKVPTANTWQFHYVSRLGKLQWPELTLRIDQLQSKYQFTIESNRWHLTKRQIWIN